MFATRTLARAPVAGRLAGSVSTLRVASLSAFTSGSKLAGFFGRASGQSGAPAFQQLGLRMSLCRAFSSQPPIQKLTEAEMIALSNKYTIDTFKTSFSKFYQALSSKIQITVIEEEEVALYPESTVIIVVTLNFMLSKHRAYHLFEATRDYRLQLLKEQGLEAYFDEVSVLMDVAFAKSTLVHPDLTKELGLSHGRLVQSFTHYQAEPEFMAALDKNTAAIDPPVYGVPGATTPNPVNVPELHARLMRYVAERRSVSRVPHLRRMYLSDRLSQDTGINMMDAMMALLAAPGGSQRLGEIHAALQQESA